MTSGAQGIKRMLGFWGDFMAVMVSAHVETSCAARLWRSAGCRVARFVPVSGFSQRTLRKGNHCHAETCQCHTCNRQAGG